MTQDLATMEKIGRLIVYDTERGAVELSISRVQAQFCKEATSAEAYAFIQLCRFHKLNPYLKEAYLVKYGRDNPAQFIVGYQAWTQRAEKSPNYQGFLAGLIIANEDGTLQYREGTFYQERERDQMVGGWCLVRMKNRPENPRIEVSLHEYIQRNRDGAPNRFWAEKPGTMIRKVAIAQAHREAFPSLFTGLYDSDEASADHEFPTDAIVVEGSAHWLPNEDEETGTIAADLDTESSGEEPVPPEDPPSADLFPDEAPLSSNDGDQSPDEGDQSPAAGEPAPTEGAAPVATSAAVFALAKELGYGPARIPTILGSRAARVTLPQWIESGKTYAEAMTRIRKYHQMDKGGPANA